jgi:hypothetical protein
LFVPRVRVARLDPTAPMDKEDLQDHLDKKDHLATQDHMLAVLVLPARPAMVVHQDPEVDRVSLAHQALTESE